VGPPIPPTVTFVILVIGKLIAFGSEQLLGLSATFKNVMSSNTRLESAAIDIYSDRFGLFFTYEGEDGTLVVPKRGRLNRALTEVIGIVHRDVKRSESSQAHSHYAPIRWRIGCAVSLIDEGNEFAHDESSILLVDRILSVSVRGVYENDQKRCDLTLCEEIVHDVGQFAQAQIFSAIMDVEHRVALGIRVPWRDIHENRFPSGVACDVQLFHISMRYLRIVLYLRCRLVLWHS